MTFKTWYEAVEKKYYPDLTAKEKNALECRFMDYLRETRHTEPIALCSQEEPNPAVSHRVAAQG